MQTTPSPTVRYEIDAHNLIGQQGSDPQIALGNGSVFVDDWTHGRIVRIDASTLKITGQLSVGSPQDSVLSIAYGGGSLWALDFSSGSLLRIDPVKLQILGHTPVGGQPSDVSYGDGKVWMTAVGRSTNPRTRQLLERVDPATGAVTGQTIIPGNGQSEQIAVGDVVAVSGETGPIQIVDPATMKITRTMPNRGTRPANMAVLNGQIYVLADTGAVELSPSDGRERPIVFDDPDTAGKAQLAQGISSAAGLLWLITPDQILGIDPSLGKLIGVGNVADAGRVQSSAVSGHSLIVEVSNGLDRLVPVEGM